MPEGLIIKALSGYYYVLPAGGGEAVQCRARGVFKKRGITPLVGDKVAYELTENGEGTVTEVHSRVTELLRPPVANVNLGVLVFSLTEPALNLQLLDKFLVHMEHSGLRAVICLTKLDLLNGPDASPPAPPVIPGAGLTLEQFVALYGGIGYSVIPVSSKRGIGTAAVMELLNGAISVFSGQSGVGKSSLLNALIPGIVLETNQISMKLGRGKHTTRHVELIPLPDGDGWVADTPGFSQLDFIDIEPVELGSCFPEFKSHAEECRFRGCLHHQEPGCGVRKALEQGTVAQSRYEHYIQFLNEMKDRKRRYER